MARKLITGVPEIEATLKGLEDKAGDRVARSAIGAGMTVLAKAIKKAAPVGKTGNLKKSIGKRYIKSRRGRPQQAKVGVNVGKQKKDDAGEFIVGNAPHSHLVALGTKQRERKEIGGMFGYLRSPTPFQLRTGVMPANDFLPRAAAGAQSAVKQKMITQAEKALKRELLKVKK